MFLGLLQFCFLAFFHSANFCISLISLKDFSTSVRFNTQIGRVEGISKLFRFVLIFIFSLKFIPIYFSVLLNEGISIDNSLHNSPFPENQSVIILLIQVIILKNVFCFQQNPAIFGNGLEHEKVAGFMAGFFITHFQL